MEIDEGEDLATPKTDYRWASDFAPRNACPRCDTGTARSLIWITGEARCGNNDCCIVRYDRSASTAEFSGREVAVRPGASLPIRHRLHSSLNRLSVDFRFPSSTGGCISELEFPTWSQSPVHFAMGTSAECTILLKNSFSASDHNFAAPRSWQ
jgi:hypothetical protein